MPQSPGTHLGPYEILTPLGAGGMGEVYRARDARLKRDVALKLLPEAFANDRERMLRFQREAEVLAALNHPNIAAIYGIEEGALVMELVEGAPLKGPLPIETALHYARQIAEALEAAHEKGITHRDLKPANIMITPAGVVKVLDFGLAKAADEPARQSDPANSPTLTMSATRVGVILGTAGYMSPEQAAGKPVDRRADIWSFGVVLWEMLTGEALFQGETVAHTLADVLRADINLDKLPSDTPPAIRDLLRRCLVRDAKNRMRDIGEARIAIDCPGKAAPPETPRRNRLPWIAAAVTTLAALALAFLRPAEEPRAIKFTITTEMPESTRPSISVNPAVSPDGRRIAFLVGQSGIWVRDLDSFTARQLAGTEGARWPFWSPDDRNIAFFADGKLKRIGMAGGPVQSLADAGSPAGGTWGTNDVIVFSNSSGLWRIPASGGTAATPLTEPDRSSGEVAHRFPCFLPDGRHFLYSAGSVDPEQSALYVGDLESKNHHLLMRSSISDVRYAYPGYLLFVRGQTLMAQPFDAGKMKFSGEPLPVAEPVTVNPTIRHAGFSISQNGVLAYNRAGDRQNVQLTWYDRSGRVIRTIGQPGMIRTATISPDGATVAYDRRDPQTGSWDVWLRDLARGTDSRFTLDSALNPERGPVWSPDSSHVAFLSIRDGKSKLYQKATSSVTEDELLDEGSPQKRVDDWSRDGRYIVLETTPAPKTGTDLWVLPLFGDRKPYPYIHTEFNEGNARLSPKGQWLVYVSNRSKRSEIYVESFPTRGVQWQVSTNGGTEPVWSLDGKELYFIGPDQKLMAVEVKTAGKFEAGAPKPLFATRLPSRGRFDVSRDGLFLIPTAIEESASVPIHVIVNWHAGLKR